MKREFIECGCCGGFHLNKYEGDCRNDRERFYWDNYLNQMISARGNRIYKNFNLISLEKQIKNETPKRKLD